MGGWAGSWVAMYVACLLARAALWVRDQTSIKNHNLATLAGMANTFSPGKKYIISYIIPNTFLIFSPSPLFRGPNRPFVWLVTPVRVPKGNQRVFDIFFFKLIYFENRYLTAIIFDETRITIRATNTKKYWSSLITNTAWGIPSADIQLSPPSSFTSCQCST